MSIDPITSLPSIKSELETGWKLFDDVYATFTPRRWSKKFGKTWTYAWQPYHLAFFDGAMAKYLALGPDAPPDRLHLRSLGEINEWNRQEFAKRGASYTHEDALKAMRESRDAIREIASTMTENDLGRRTWMPLLFGWVTARDVLHAVINHNVAEYWKLWIRTGKRSAAPSPAAVHMRLDFMMNFMPSTLNRELAAKTPFTVTWNFDGPGGGVWTFTVADGKCEVSTTPAARPNLSITMKPETFHKLVAKMTPPPLLILSGQMKIKGFGAMGTFGKLFPEPRPDQALSPSGGLVVG